VKGNGGGGDGSKSYKVATARKTILLLVTKKLKGGVLQQPLQKL
jgi:hypothetical protein